MAKPGDRAAAAAAVAASGAVDLGKRQPKSLDEQRYELETKLGMRCGHCKRRMVRGFEFVMFAVAEVRGADRVVAPRQYACDRDECEGYRQQLAGQSNVMWALTPRMYLDELRGEEVIGAVEFMLDARIPRAKREAFAKAQGMVEGGAMDAAFAEGLDAGLAAAGGARVDSGELSSQTDGADDGREASTDAGGGRAGADGDGGGGGGRDAADDGASPRSAGGPASEAG